MRDLALADEFGAVLLLTIRREWCDVTLDGLEV